MQNLVKISKNIAKKRKQGITLEAEVNLRNMFERFT